MSESCRHLFTRLPSGWRHGFQWECSKCGYLTRTYDAVDRMGMRPIHPHMSVAVPGYNTK